MLLALTIFAVAACSAGEKPPGRAIGSGNTGGGGTTGQGGSVPIGGATATGGASGTGIIVGTGGTSNPGPCEDGSWACKIVDCEAEGLPKTTVTATVYDP